MNSCGSSRRRMYYLAFFLFIKQENWSAVIHSQAQIPLPSNIYEENASRPQETGSFDWLPFQPHGPSCPLIHQA